MEICQCHEGATDRNKTRACCLLPLVGRLRVPLGLQAALPSTSQRAFGVKHACPSCCQARLRPLTCPREDLPLGQSLC